MIWESPVFFGCKNGHGSSCCFEMRQIFFTNAVGLGSVPASVLWAPEKKKTSCQMKISMSHAFSCVPVSSQLSAECQFFPCWATEWAVGFVDSTRFTGKGCSLGSSLYSLSRCSLGNPSKFFSFYCPAKISHCCLERNIWRVRKKITSTELLSSSRTSSGFGGGMRLMWLRKKSFQERPVWCKHSCNNTGYLLQNGSLPSCNLLNLAKVVSVLFGVLGNST